MIYKVEEIFEQLFDTIPTYDIDIGGNPVTTNKLVFSYGEKKALNQLLIGRYDANLHSYPLLWYNLPNKVISGNTYANGDFEFILATNTRPDLYNDERMKENFAKVLYPNLELVIQALQKANNIRLRQIDKTQWYESENYPNYGNPSETENKTLDYWDAIWFKVKLDIFNKCTLPIVYNTTNLI